MAQVTPEVQTFIALLPKAVVPLLDKVSPKWMDKDQAYSSRDVLGVAKAFRKLPPRTVLGWYKVLFDVRMKIGTLRLDRGDPLDDLAAKLMSIWRAANLVMQENEDTALGLKKRIEDAPYGRYLPRAELKKRRQISPKLIDRIREWVGNRPSDPIHKLVLQARNDHRWVKTTLIETALAHLKVLRDLPEHEGAFNDIEDIRVELSMEGGTRMASLRTQLIRLAHEKPEFRPHLLPMLSKRASEDGAEADEEEAQADQDKAQAKEEDAEAERLKQAAVDKVPVFPKFEVTLTAAKIEKMFKEHYPFAVLGSLEISRRTWSGDNSVNVNVTMKNADPNPEAGYETLGGTLVMRLEPQGNTVRCYSFVNIDG